MFKRAGFGILQDILGSGQEALKSLRSGKVEVAPTTDEVVDSPNTPPGAPDGIKQHSPKAKPSPDAKQFNNTTNPSVYQRICDEWKKIADPNTGFEYFASKYVFINNQLHGYVNFNLYEYQKRTARILQDNRFVITKKFRQAGCSLLTGVYCLWYSLINPRMQCMVISIGQRESTKYLQENCKEVYESLPKWLRGGLNDKGLPIKWDRQKAYKDSATELWLPNRSKIRSIPSGKAGGRSFTTKILVIDEAAFIERIDTLWTGIYPTIVNSFGKVFVVSTVNGVGGTGGWFFQKYKEALAGENDFKIAQMDYTEHPDYNNPEWADSVLRQLGQRKWDQEVLGKFLASGNTYISHESIETMEKQADIWKKETPPKQEHGGKLLVWKEFIAGHRYSIGADCATAGGLDKSTFQVVDLTAGEQVAEFCGKLPEGKFAQILAHTGYRYGTAYIAVEINATAGGAVITSLKGIQKYRRIWTQENGTVGWQTTVRTRNTIVADLETAIYDNSWKIRGHRTIDELKTFIVTKTGKIEHDANAHDDLIFAWMIATSPQVIRIAQRATPQQPDSILLVQEGGDAEGEIISKPVYSPEKNAEDLRKKRADLMVGTKYGEFLDKMADMNEVAGEDVLAFLLQKPDN